MYLITKWFGIFLIQNNNIIKKKLFSKDIKIIANNLKKIENNEVLIDEIRILKHYKKEKIYVNEKRLNKIGIFNNEDNFFNIYDIKASDFNYDIDLLKKASILFVNNKIDKKLRSLDYQIIQMVKTLDSLIQTSNLLNERLDNWLDIYTPKYKIQPFKKIIIKINKEIQRIETQIKKDIIKIAPNCSNIIGPVITARMIALAGSIEKLSKMPASTIQILGAENAFFRYKKEGGKNPKHGIIYQNNLINKSPKIFRGKISRLIANKLTIAIKADCYTKRDISGILQKDIKIKIKEIKQSKK